MIPPSDSDFVIPPSLVLQLSKSPTPLFFTSYSLEVLPQLNGSISHITSSIPLAGVSSLGDWRLLKLLTDFALVFTASDNTFTHRLPEIDDPSLSNVSISEEAPPTRRRMASRRAPRTTSGLPPLFSASSTFASFECFGQYQAVN